MTTTPGGTVSSPAPPRPTPTGRARLLGSDDVIVSKTDLRGHLTYVNDTFLDISGYREDQLLGRPHNMIRHPGMPRAVFDLLWSELGAGREVFAYVVNLCADGDHYWVFAHVTPSLDAGGRTVGYHSNRRAPDPQAVRRVESLYAHLVGVENAQGSGRAATAAGSAALGEALAQQGLPYDTWVWTLLEDAA